ncbi:MAG: fatty acyl-CoA reductase [Myxococcales bacterium]|jgi:long-chain acyl-CoA synthetase
MSESGNAISIREAYAGKHVLLTGASGFLGKVWLARMLEHVPEVGRIYVLLRPRALVPAAARFDKMMTSSPAFRRLHDLHGAGLTRLLADKVEVIEGELCEPNLGMSDALVRRLRRDLDLVVHCAGLVDFNPDLAKAVASNVDATLRVADLVEGAERARLLHISTCYVAGSRYGRIRERVIPDYAPEGDGFDPEREVAEAHAEGEAIRVRHETPEHRAQIEDEVREMVAERRSGNQARLIKNLTRRRLREELKRELADAGMARAKRWGWPNTYTYTKSMAESLLWRRRDRLELSILRPSIVESSLEFPFPGWNESFNGSAPLAYVMGTWFRIIPARPNAPFDVIPVDMVANAMVIAGGAMLEDRHAPVYHVGTSDRNRCSVGRAADLIVLAHRRHDRQAGRSRTERLIKSRWDAVLTDVDDVFSVDRNRNLVGGVLEALDLLPDKLHRKARRLIERTERVDRRLAELQNLIDLYKPFMHDSFYVFESRALDRTVPVEPELRFEPEKLDWRRYWLEVHVPGLRRWAFPLIDGKRPERYRAEHPVTLSKPPPPPAPPTRAVAKDLQSESQAESHAEQGRVARRAVGATEG